MSTRYPHKKYAWATVTSAPSPALSGVTVGMDSLSNLPSTYPYPATLVPNPATTTPTDANTEEVMVTATPGSTNLTITRAISGDAVAVDANYQLIAGITPKVFLEIEAELDEIAVDIDLLDSELATKADSVHNHNDLYFTEVEVNALLNSYALTNHNHDTRYYTEEEIDILLSDIENHSHTTGEITALAEYIRDTIGNTLVAGSNIALNVDDETDGITISSLASTAYQDWLNAGNSGSLQDFLDSLVGPEGDAGPGVPAGGTTGQALVKNSDTDYDTEWTSINSATWGNITGTLADQTDLQDELNGKSDTGHTHDDRYYTDTETDALLASKVDENSAITGATKTKITYDAKGLVTAGADATQDDIGDGSTYKQYSSTEKTKLAGIETAADVTDAGNVGSSIHGASAKTTPVDADTVALIDSAASNVLKKLSWSNIKATLKTYLDTLYVSSTTTRTMTVDDAEPGSPAEGDVWVKPGSATGIVTETSTQTLTNKTIDGDDNTFQNIPASAVNFSGAVLTKSANQSIGHNSWTAVTWNTEEVDTHSYHDNSSDTNRLTAPTNGYYRVSYHVSFAPNATGTRRSRMRVNGDDSNYYGHQEITSAHASVSLPMVDNRIFQLSSGDYVELVVIQTSGGNLNLNSDASNEGISYFSMERLGG